MFDLDRRRLLSVVGTASTGTVLSTTDSNPDGTDERGESDTDSETGRDADSDRGTGNEPDTDRETGESTAVEFRDCETVRVTGSAADVIVSLCWWDETGAIGTIAEPVGPVEGERTISVTEEFGTFAYGPVVTEVELFDAETPVVPGLGDPRASNPDVESCVASIRDAYDSPGTLEPIDPDG